MSERGPVWAPPRDRWSRRPRTLVKPARESIPRYGRIAQMIQSGVGGTSTQTIVCRDADGYREVCVFNTEGAEWTEAREAELQVVLSALQEARHAKGS